MSTDGFGQNGHGMAGRSCEQQWTPDQSCPEKPEILDEIKQKLNHGFEINYWIQFTSKVLGTSGSETTKMRCQGECG